MNTYCFVKYIFALYGVYINIYILEPTSYQNNTLLRELLPKKVGSAAVSAHVHIGTPLLTLPVESWKESFQRVRLNIHKIHKSGTSSRANNFRFWKTD